ncbi:MAG: hypothetical protein GY738_09645 [Pseudoalteromonas sp.]|nr:hypothetical protein [Pseudoalteromonas sp.]
MKALLVEMNLMPGILANGQRLIQIKLTQFRIKFLDSFLFTHLPLSKLGEAFALDYSKTW